MNGPEHYKQAEKDLKTAEEKDLSTGEAQFYLASAQGSRHSRARCRHCHGMDPEPTSLR